MITQQTEIFLRSTLRNSIHGLKLIVNFITTNDRSKLKYKVFSMYSEIREYALIYRECCIDYNIIGKRKIQILYEYL